MNLQSMSLASPSGLHASLQPLDSEEDTMYRFLRARKFSVEAAADMLQSEHAALCSSQRDGQRCCICSSLPGEGGWLAQQLSRAALRVVLPTGMSRQSRLPGMLAVPPPAMQTQ